MYRKEKIHVSDVAKYIFETNEDSIIYLEVASLKTTKELFYFLFDVFCKGLIILFGTNNQVELNMLTAEQFALVGEKLRYANIKLCISSFQRDTAELMDLIDEKSSSKMILDRSLKRINDMNENEPLETYVLDIMMDNNLHQVSFKAISL
jgi:hypothetical protein